jgi:hypothetical protein
MALALLELKDSQAVERTTDSATANLKYIAYYSSDRAAVYALAVAGSPLTYAGFNRQKIKCTPVGAGFWMVDCDYGFTVATDTPETPDDGTALGTEYSFDITAQQIHITQSLETRYRYVPADNLAIGTNLTVDGTSYLKVTPDGYAPVVGDIGKKVLIVDDPLKPWAGGNYAITAVAGGKWTLDASPAVTGTTGGKWALVAGLTPVGNAANFKRAIGVSKDRIEGTDIYYPHFEFTYKFQSPLMTLPYLRACRKLCGKVNAAAFRSFAVGEVLYLGATASSGPDAWSVTHKFAVGENQYAVQVSDDLIVPFKGAWEYLWCTYKAGTNAGVPVQVPSSVYVERVYRYADFNLLGIGA